MFALSFETRNFNMENTEKKIEKKEAQSNIKV